MSTILETKDGFKWLKVTDQSDEFLQKEMNKGNLYILHDDETETAVQDIIDLTEAYERNNTLVIEF